MATTTMGNGQQGTRGLSGADWTRIQRLRQARSYATNLTTDKDISPTAVPQTSPHLSSAVNVFNVVGTSKIRRPASSWTDYAASQTGDFVLASQTATTGTAVTNTVTKLCNCVTTRLTTKAGSCTKCNGGGVVHLRLA